MSDPNFLLLEALPQAAIQIAQGRIVYANSLAQHYLPQLQTDGPVPVFLPPPQDAGEDSGVFTAGLSAYSYHRTYMQDATLIFFHPAPQTALTDSQLDGVLRQMRTVLMDVMAAQPEESGVEGQGSLRRSFYRLFRLVDNLDMLRLAGSETVPFRPVTMDLAGLCRHTCAQADTLLRSCGVKLVFRSSLASLLIPGDPQLLGRLLMELISNCVRAVGRGSVTVTLRSQEGRAVLSVSDSAQSVTTRQISAMVGQDTDQQIPMPQSGAGLGLSIARHIAALHAGSLLVGWGQGAPTVVLSLPTGPLDTRTSVNAPRMDNAGGLSPLLVALADVLSTGIFELEDLK